MFTSWPSCTCHDIPRSDCCYCGARPYDQTRADNDLKTCLQREHSADMAWWAFGVEPYSMAAE